jgi:hypothetical protein
VTVPTISTRLLHFDSKRKVLSGEASTCGLGALPREVVVISHHTGKRLRFFYDEEKARQHEYWDGEMAEYVPERSDVPRSVTRLVLIND